MISILMPVYNGIEFIEESINSIKQQTYNNWELIIGINGHLENSDVFKTAKKYECENIKVYDMIHVKGKSNALNKMLDFCKYNWVSILDVDDLWLPHKLEYQIPYIKNYDIIGTNCKYFGESNKIPRIPLGDFSNFNFLLSNPVINSSCLIKKELCYWDSKYDSVEDYKLWLTLWSKKKLFFNIPEILTLHRIHNNSYFNTNCKQETLVKKLKDIFKDYKPNIYK